MDADADVLFGAMDVCRVSAGKAAIVWVTAGLPAVVRIPVLSSVVISHDVIKFVTVVIKINMNIMITRADSLIVHLNIFLFCAGLIDGEDPV